MAQDLGDRPWYGDWPQGVPKMIDFPNISLSDLLRDTTGQYPNEKAIVFLDSVMTYRELDDAVDRFATALANLGLVKGDVLALILPNSFQFVIAFYAAQRLGMAVTAINPTYKGLEIKHQLNDSGAKALVVLDSVYAEAGRILAQTGVKHVIGTNVVDLVQMSGLKKWLGKKLGKIPTGQLPANALSFKDLMATAPNPPQVTIDPMSDIAALQYTGGTTGTPKGAMLTSYNLVTNAISGKAWIGDDLPAATGWLGVLPLFHVFAMTCCMNIAVATGGFMLLFPKPPDTMLEWAAEVEKWGKGTQMCMAGVAVLFNKINNTEGLEKYDLSALTTCLSGAGPLPRDVQLKFEEKTGARVVEGYGLSESSPVVTANPIVDPPGKERVMGSIGLPFPNTDCKIMDIETGDNQLGLGEDQVGELCVKGPQVMKGYLNRPEESERTLRDGWLYTGDIAYMNERGWIFIMDRAKDLVKFKGFSVFPKEVEDYMFSHPDILEVAVIGLPHPKVGEILKAFVVLQPESEGKVSEEEIIAWCKENMTHYKVPSLVEFRDELPKTMVGKVLRRVLKEEEQAKAS
ncbi:MAG: long-chain fatty acid--CoA ligase [Desulfarculaceae bacterium]|nr:long-chain fatty acid--CoA ligase [Desulfarculaceae bacterium]MCF8074083.1 long-chain fatty acid--CoA ligase [Desulfarculaceae bacterium]MCF8102079.1 long-chain fatty acid--CoA ligase [Desulfarculaceae bacterium]MCF8118117.1 long-chain fatty acid--CoA ligase [Desulfarculaceae bacterium]